MKDNLLDKKIIESNNMHDLCYEFSWLSRVHLGCVFLIDRCFLPKLFFNIELIGD